MVLLFVLGLFQINGVNGQGPATNEVPQPHIDFFSASLDICDGTKHVYLEFNTDSFHKRSQKVSTDITRIDVSPKGGQRQIVSLTGGSFEVEFFNLVPVNGFINFDLVAYASDGSKVVDTEISVSTEKEKGVVDVSPKMEKHLDEFKKSGRSLFTYFCGKKISKVELLAFFQDFLELDEQQICLLLNIYNTHYGTSSFEVWNQNLSKNWLTCLLLEEFENSIVSGGNGGSSGGGSDSCACQMIRTKSSALNYGASEYLPTDECTDYTPYTKGKNYDNKNNDNDLIFSQGRFGAAKAATIEFFYDGNDDSPEDFTINTDQGWSTLIFRSVCIDPTTLTFDTTNCSSCKKVVEVDYSYHSSVFLKARTMSCVLCKQEAQITLEDVGFLVVQNGDEITVDSMGRRFQAICDVDPNDPNLDTLLANGPGLINTIAGAFNGVSVEGIANAVAATVELLNITFVEDLCNKPLIEHYTLLGGTKTFILEPGDKIQMSIFSDAFFRGEVWGHGTAIGSIESQFHLASVLKTVPNDDGEVPAYCDCEQLASYAIGSLDPFSPDQSFPVDEPNNVETDWTEIFDAGSINMNTMRQRTGAFIGTAGLWGDEFQTSGCCDVVIPCHSDCVYVRGCDELGMEQNTLVRNNEDDARMLIEPSLTNTETLSGSSTTDGHVEKSIADNILDLVVYPNPTTSQITIGNRNNSTLHNYMIYSIDGNLLKSDQVGSKGNATIDLSEMPIGLLILYIRDKSGQSSVHKIIKQ